VIGGKPGWLPVRPLLVALVLAMLGDLPGAQAHESRPGYLEIKETAPGRYDVLWRTPLYSGKRLPLALKFPDQARHVTPPKVQELPDSLIERRWIDVGAAGLAGQRIEFVGLQATIIDVLVRVTNRDGSHLTTLVRPSQPWFDLAAQPSKSGVAGTYFLLGIEHILLGVDHLLFVLALLILVKSGRRLVGTVTAFTVAHSITLAAATLGFVRVPGPPVEAVIALSIAFLACEIVHKRQGRTGLTERWPWVVTFTFGLLHGFGFASALHKIGVPETAIPLALLFFNVSVEIGQLAFIASVMVALAGAAFIGRRLSQLGIDPKPVYAASESVAAYAIGSIAAFWLIDRTLGFII